MATDLPSTHQQSTQSASTSTYSAQHASSLFDAFLHQSDSGPLPPPTSSTAVSATVSQQSSPSAPVLARSTSVGSSSSLAAALSSPEEHSRPSAGNYPEPRYPSPSSADTQDEDEQSPSQPQAKKYKVHVSADQPLTAHGKPRERVYLACVQW